MRPLVVTQNVSLDGSIEFLGDWFDPSDEGDSEHNEVMRAQAGEEGALLLGRQTFTDFRGYWPLQTDDRTGVTEILNRTQKYVVSQTLTDPAWQNSTVLGADWVEQVGALKNADEEGQIGLTGSISLCHAAIEAGLVDEYRLFVYPVSQGGGRRLFPDGYETSGLRPLETRAFGNGVVLLRYAAGQG